jgi:bifunctional non-homologous end joining protein LigD
MKAVSGDLPHGEGWAFEIKWDGIRAIAEVRDGHLSLWSSNAIEMTVRFPELAGLAGAVGPARAVLDGEIVAFDEHDRPSFGLLQQRMHLTEPTAVARQMVEVPVVYQIFDLLHLDGHDLFDLPYLERRRLLVDLVEEDGAWRVPPHHVGDGDDLYAVAEEQRLEGLVAKRVDSRYLPGARSRSWIKVKVRPQQEFVVGGWTSGEGSRADLLGALLVGYYDDGVLRYAGKVGTGFGEVELRRLDPLLRASPIDESPFDPPPPRDIARRAHYVEPTMVVEVAFGEWTGDGRLRHPAYLGARDDKQPHEVVREA